MILFQVVRDHVSEYSGCPRKLDAVIPILRWKQKRERPGRHFWLLFLLSSKYDTLTSAITSHNNRGATLSYKDTYHIVKITCCS